MHREIHLKFNCKTNTQQDLVRKPFPTVNRMHQQYDNISDSLSADVGTPTKRSISKSHVEPNTADSFPASKQKQEFTTPDSLKNCKQQEPGLQVEAEQLFERFHEIMTISEHSDDQQELEECPENVFRKLDYGQNQNYSSPSQKKITKLDFSPMPVSSMKKRQNKILNIENETSVKARELFKVLPVDNGENEVAVLKAPKTEKVFETNSVQSTPPKRQKGSLNKRCQLTAKKQEPYRDLRRKD